MRLHAAERPGWLVSTQGGFWFLFENPMMPLLSHASGKAVVSAQELCSVVVVVVVVVVVTTPHTDANSIQKDNHQLSTQFKKTKRGPAFRAK